MVAYTKISSICTLRQNAEGKTITLLEENSISSGVGDDKDFLLSMI